MYSKFDDHKANTLKHIEEAKGAASRNTSPKMVRASVVKAMGHSLLQNLRNTPTGDLNKAIDATEAHLDEIVAALG